jgi:exodeoxyribonuclease V alpha subunit
MNAALSPQQQLAAGFARHVVAWARDMTPGFASSDVLEQAAYQVSFATTQGHVCAPIEALLDAFPSTRVSDLEATLVASGLVGRPPNEHSLPLVLDEDGRLYLHRYFDYERRLAAGLWRLASFCIDEGSISPATRSRLTELFDRSESGPDWQKIAAALALLRRLTIISGGPGTGKTTTVVNLLACLVEEQPNCRIALAAPTGKAAARMLGALRERAAHLPAEIRKALPETAFTVHRLLGVLPQGGFRYHADNPLALDVLVVDEASMLDLSLATHLVEALPANARLILLGDKDQLAAVEAGSVFAEIAADARLSPETVSRLAELTDLPPERIVPPNSMQPTALRDCVVWFSRNYRFREDSGIGLLASLVNRGEADATGQWLTRNDDDQITWVNDCGNTLAPTTLERLMEGYANYLDGLQTARPTDVSGLFDRYNAFRILCAIRGSSRGVEFLNREVTREFRRRLSHPMDRSERAVWFPGRPVLILRNDYALQLFNGDIGLTLVDESGELRVYFPEGEGGFRAIPPVRLPEHESAFAMTVHKSQGSEFDAIAVVLPHLPLPVVTRELIYTGITRARRQVMLVGGIDVLGAGVTSPTRRHSGLIARLDRHLPTAKDAGWTAP